MGEEVFVITINYQLGVVDVLVFREPANVKHSLALMELSDHEDWSPEFTRWRSGDRDQNGAYVHVSRQVIG